MAISIKDVYKNYVYLLEEKGLLQIKKTLRSAKTLNDIPEDIERYWVSIYRTDWDDIVKQERSYITTIDNLTKYNEKLSNDKKELEIIKNDLEFELQEKNKKLKKIAYYENLNKNLIRICKERANKERKISKKSNGFIVVKSYQKTITATKNDNFKRKTIEKKEIWETIIQTPYSSDFSYEDLIVLSDNLPTEIKKYIEKYNNNFQKGFWELILQSGKYIDFNIFLKKE